MYKIYDGEKIFKFMYKGPENSNCTAPYNISLLKDVTLGEFIDIVTLGTDEIGRTEWGHIGFGQGYYPFSEHRCEYRYGHIVKSNIPTELLTKKVIRVRASGGWSCMDYVVDLEEE